MGQAPWRRGRRSRPTACLTTCSTPRGDVVSIRLRPALEAQGVRSVELIGRRRMLQKALRKAGPVLRFCEHLVAGRLEGIVSKKLTGR